MRKISAKVLMDGKEMDIVDASLNKRGGLSGNQLTFTVPGDDVSFRKYWNKEVTFFLHKDDAYPLFRGRIMNSNIVDTYKVKFTATDVMGYLGGHQKATISLNEEDNIDGLTVGGAIKKMIEMASLGDIIGTDYIGDTSPIISTTPLYFRGSQEIISIIKALLNQAINTDGSIPLENIIMVKDDGSKSQLMITLQSDVETAQPVYTFDKSNILTFKVQNREIPTTIIVTGAENISAKVRHESAATSLGENFFTVTNPVLKSKAECYDFATKLFQANLRDQYEYRVSSYQGVYLEENDIVRIVDDKTEVNGSFRVIGKNIKVTPRSYQVSININKRPPILAQFLEGN